MDIESKVIARYTGKTSNNSRTKTAANPERLSQYIKLWLGSIGKAIVSKGVELNPHMKGSVKAGNWYRVDLSLEGESPSDIPADGFALLELRHDNKRVAAVCSYQDSHRGNSDSTFELGIDEDPEKFIEYVAKFLVGWMAR